MKTDSRLSRRRLLASVPAVAAAGVPAAATALGGLATGAADDPIFAAIERHRKAFDAYREAKEHHHELREEHEAERDPQGIYLGEYPEIEMVTEYSDGRTCRMATEADGRARRADLDNSPKGDISSWGPVATGRMVPRYATLPWHIDYSVPADCADPDAWKAEKWREFKQWSGICDGSPASIASDARNEAHARLIEATAALNARPATLAGVAALLRTVAEFYDGDEGSIWGGTIYAEDEDGDADYERKPLVDNAGILQEILETLAEVVESTAA